MVLILFVGALLVALPAIVGAVTVSTWDPVTTKTNADLPVTVDGVGSLAASVEVQEWETAESAAIRTAISTELEVRAPGQTLGTVTYYPYCVSVDASGAATAPVTLTVSVTGLTLAGVYDGVVVKATGGGAWAALRRDASLNSYSAAGVVSLDADAVSLYVTSFDGGGQESLDVRLAFFTVATPTPTSTPTGTPTPVVSPVPTLAPTLTPAPTVAPRATETPLPTETPVASPTGTLQPTPGTSLIPTVGLIGETLSGITNGAVYSLGSDPLASQRAAEFRNLILGTGTTSGTRASQVRASSFGYQARDLIQRFMGVPVNRYTANIAVTPVNLLQGDGTTLYADLTFRRSAADAAARSEIFLVLPTYEAGASGTRTMTGFVLLTPHSTASATERTFRVDVVDNAVRDRNGVTGKMEAEYYVVRVAANPGQLVSATPTSHHRSSGGCSAFGYGPLALLLLAPLSLLKRRR